MWRAATHLYLFDDGVRSCLFAGATGLTGDIRRFVAERLAKAGRTLERYAHAARVRIVEPGNSFALQADAHPA